MKFKDNIFLHFLDLKEVRKAMYDASVYGTSAIIVTKDGKMKHIPYRKLINEKK